MAIVLTMLYRVKDAFYAEAIIVGCITLVVATLLLSKRKNNLTAILQNSERERIAALQDYFDRIEQNRMKWMIPGIVFICLLTIAMIILLFNQPHSKWAGWVTALWLGSVLISIAMRWINMTDQFMLQDLKHRSREDHSEISE